MTRLYPWELMWGVVGNIERPVFHLGDVGKVLR